MSDTFPTKPTAPVIERHHGNNKPYRGIEDHGIPDTVEPTDIVGWDNSTAVAYTPDEPEPTPIPVRVVSSKSKERKDLRSGSTIVNNERRPIVGLQTGRTSAKIINESADVTIRIGDESVSTFNGYPVGPGKETTINAESAVYSVSDNGSDVKVSWLTEFAVEI